MEYLVRHENCEDYTKWEVTEGEDCRIAKIKGYQSMEYILDGDSMFIATRKGKVVFKIPAGEVWDVVAAILLMHKNKPLLGKAEVFLAPPSVLYGD